MAILVLGLALFLGIHLLPVLPALRTRLLARLGEGPYKGLFSIVSAAGLTLIIGGWWMRPPPVQVFAPFPEARAAAPILVSIAFVLFAAANMRTHLRARLRHPMLIGLALWSGTHLLANGDLASTILFGSFLAYSIVDLASAVHRGARKPFEPSWVHDAIAIASGAILAGLTIRYHAQLFGVAVG